MRFGTIYDKVNQAVYDRVRTGKSINRKIAGVSVQVVKFASSGENAIFVCGLKVADADEAAHEINRLQI